MTGIKIAVPASGPLYEGHFPGLPILPGIGLIDLSIRALTTAGAAPTLREITSLRLRKLVVPGDSLDLAMKSFEPDGAVRFEVRRGAEIVANASVVLGACRSHQPDRAPIPCGPRRVVEAPPLDSLLPHRPPMRFIEGVEAELDDGLVCAASVPGRSAFAEDGSAPGIVAVEMAAQCAAVFEALRRTRKDEGAGPLIGYLVGARDVRFARGRVEADRSFLATIRQSMNAPPLSTYGFAVEDGVELVASGSLSTWLTATPS